MTSNLALFTRFWSAQDGFARLVFSVGFSGAVAIAESKVDPDLVAPASVFLEANVTDFGVSAGATSANYDPQFHDIEYIWSVTLDGDAGYASETYDKLTKLPGAHEVKGTRYGKRIGHIMERPGTYNFTVTAVNLATGESATSSTVSYTVVDPDSYFSAAETFLVASDNDFTGAPSSGTGTTQRYTTISAADTAIEAVSGLSKYRLLIKRGTTYAEAVPRPPRFSSSTWTTVMIGAWGTGANPVVNGVKFSDAKVQDSILSYRCADIDTNETGLVGESGFPAFFSSHMDQGPVVTLWNMTGNSPTGVYGENDTSADDYVAIGNCTFKSTFFGIASFDPHGLEVLGCNFYRDPDGPSSLPIPNNSRASYHFRHAPKSGSWGFRYSQSQFFNRMGWFDNVPSIQTTQPNFRIAATEGGRVTFDRCVIEGGYQSVQMDEGSGDLERNVLMDRCMVLGNMDTRNLVTLSGRGATFRNNVFINSGSRPPQGGSFERSVFINFFGDGGLAATTPSKVYNNTFIGLQDTAASGLPSSGDSGVVVANNLEHEPYATVPVDTLSWNLTEVFTPDYKGYWDTETATGNSTETPLYIAYHNPATISGTFGVGNTVRGQSSGVEKVFVALATDGNNSEPVAGTNGDPIMLFETTVTNGIPAENFTAGEVLEDLTSGATVTLRTSADDNQVPVSGRWDTSLVPGTPTATHYLAYDNLSGSFTEGATLSDGGSKSATICQVYELTGTTGILWLRDITGTFANNDSLTDDATGVTADASAAQASAGTGAVWVPTAAVTPDTATWATTPYARRDFYGTTSHNSKGAVKV